MFLLLLKSEKPRGLTSLDFVGVYSTRETAVRHVGNVSLPFKPGGFGNIRMLICRGGQEPKTVLESALVLGSCYLLVEY